MDDTTECACGHVLDEHSGLSFACEVDGCGCIYFDAGTDDEWGEVVTPASGRVRPRDSAEPPEVLAALDTLTEFVESNGYHGDGAGALRTIREFIGADVTDSSRTPEKVCLHCGHDVPYRVGSHHAIGCPRWEPPANPLPPLESSADWGRPDPSRWTPTPSALPESQQEER